MRLPAKLITELEQIEQRMDERLRAVPNDRAMVARSIVTNALVVFRADRPWEEVMAARDGVARAIALLRGDESDITAKSYGADCEKP